MNAAPTSETANARPADEAQTICTVTFQPVGRRVRVPIGTTLLEAGRAAGLELAANCGGIGVCRKCRVTVEDGDMATPAPAEITSITPDDLARGVRLSCRAEPAGDVRVAVPAAFGKGQRLQLRGKGEALSCDPAVIAVQIPPLPLDGSRSDWSRFLEALKRQDRPGSYTASPAVLARLSAVMRGPEPAFTAFLSEGWVMDIHPPKSRPLGLAIDLGCTKIAAYLIDLATGEELAVGGSANPQIAWGEDLIARLVHAAKGHNQAAELAAAVRLEIQRMAESLSNSTGLPLDHVTDACIVGNTAMIHLLLGLPVTQLLHAPFVSCCDASLRIEAAEIGLTLGREARVFIPPAIGGFVGADHVAVMVAHDIGQRPEVVLAVDIGTNTEISLALPNRGLLLATSVPSGPAFEGGHIRDGMRAAPGAVERVLCRAGSLKIETIDGKPPVGLCGSGVIDLCAGLLATSRINARGLLDSTADGVRRGAEGTEYVVCTAEASGHGRDVVFTQSDISEIQLVKAAIMAGISVLLGEAAIGPEAVDRLILAGAFGSHIDLESAVTIGLLPAFPNASYHQVGNAAGDGARMMLVSRQARAAGVELAKQTRRCELKEHPLFNRFLARATRFPTFIRP